MTLAKAVRRRVHSIASRGCVNQSKRITEFVMQDLCPISVVNGKGSLTCHCFLIKTWWVELCLSCSCPFALHLGYPDVENPHPLQP